MLQSSISQPSSTGQWGKHSILLNKKRKKERREKGRDGRAIERTTERDWWRRGVNV